MPARHAIDFIAVHGNHRLRFIKVTMTMKFKTAYIAATIVLMTSNPVLAQVSVPAATYPPAPEQPASLQPAPVSAAEALRPYYAANTAPLPKAPPGIALDTNTALTRFAFGSCLNENRAMPVWDVIAAQKPQAFLFIGDNVYGDTGATMAANMPTLTASYRKLNTRQEYARFRAAVPMITVWDDHDYGANDAGGSFAFKEYGEKVYEEYWGSRGEVRARPGVYDSYMIGPKGKRVQFIILDSRFFRSDLARANYQDPAPKLGWNIPNMDPKATMLGDAQWAWLSGELSKPADLRFIISSTQLITGAHGYEGWLNFPLEREKLYTMLAAKRVNNAVFLSGDRHMGALYKTNVPGLSRPLYEFTASSLNLSFGKGDAAAKEPDPARMGGIWADENFGQIDIDWKTKKVKMTLKKSDGKVLEEHSITHTGL
jgi:alkaline phosphatase D